jgi:proline dehydrogenase
MWQAAMIALARSQWLKKIMQGGRAGSFLSRRFVAGMNAEGGVETAQSLLKLKGLRSSLFYLGEYVDSTKLVEENVSSKVEALQALGKTELDVHVSLDPTQIGHTIDPAMARDNAHAIAKEIGLEIGPVNGDPSSVHCVMFDMEDASLNDPTIAVHDSLKQQGYHVALTLQAYLRRTEQDMRSQILAGSKVRLVKGAFVAGPDISFTSQSEIKANYRKLIDLMLSGEAREKGFYPIIATHDDALHGYTQKVARENGWKQGEYEFEMLMGVRQDVAEALAAKGERVRLYVPFGKDWWPYAVRRIGENPRNAVLLLRSLLSRG